jgi:hypothetical protein
LANNDADSGPEGNTGTNGDGTCSTTTTVAITTSATARYN